MFYQYLQLVITFYLHIDWTILRYIASQKVFVLLLFVAQIFGFVAMILDFCNLDIANTNGEFSTALVGSMYIASNLATLLTSLANILLLMIVFEHSKFFNRARKKYTLLSFLMALHVSLCIHTYLYGWWNLPNQDLDAVNLLNDWNSQIQFIWYVISILIDFFVGAIILYATGIAKLKNIANIQVHSLYNASENTKHSSIDFRNILMILKAAWEVDRLSCCIGIGWFLNICFFFVTISMLSWTEAAGSDIYWNCWALLPFLSLSVSSFLSCAFVSPFFID